MLDELLLPVKNEMERVESLLDESLTSGISLITQAAHYVTKNGGKRVRPAIFLLSARMAGNTNSGLAHLAAAIELIHTASLLHDDVVDNATLRRGKPSAKAKWGNQISILVGDFLWCKASEFLISHGSGAFWKAVTRAITAITEGEILELTKMNDIAIDEHTYQKIIEGKTAALFGVCGEGAAIMQNLSGNLYDALLGFGFNIGIAFQLTDDVLDYTSDDARLGKDSGSDIRQGKLTLPIIISLKRSSAQERNTIRDAIISGAVSRPQFKTILDVMERYGGLSETSKLARQYANTAKDFLTAFKPSIERDALMGIADYVTDRRE